MATPARVIIIRDIASRNISEAPPCAKVGEQTITQRPRRGYRVKP